MVSKRDPTSSDFSEKSSRRLLKTSSLSALVKNKIKYLILRATLCDEKTNNFFFTLFIQVREDNQPPDTSWLTLDQSSTELFPTSWFRVVILPEEMELEESLFTEPDSKMRTSNLSMRSIVFRWPTLVIRDL